MLKYSHTYSESYQKLRRLRSEYISEVMKCIDGINIDGLILDIGCAYGDINQWIINNGIKARYIGIDNSIDMAKNFKRTNESGYIINCNAKMLPFNSESFNNIILNNVVHLIELNKEFIESIIDNLKEQGRIVIGMADVNELPYYWEYEFFPKALEIDSKRLPTINFIISRCTEANVKYLYSKRVLLEERVLGGEFINRVKKRHISSLWIIPQNDYKDGLKKLEIKVAEGRKQKQKVYTNILVFQK